MKKSKKTIKEALKETKKSVAKETPKTPEAPAATEAKEEKQDDTVEVIEAVEIKEEEKKEEKKPSSKKPKKEEKEVKVEEPEVIEPEAEPVAPIGKELRNIDPNDRIDANHQIDLMNMVHHEYVKNPKANPAIQIAMKKQFDAMAMLSLIRYNAQVESDFQTLGIKVPNTLAVQMEKVAREVFGITLKGLPAPDDPNQKVINFSESLPQDIKKEAIADIKAEKKSIPQPDPEMKEKDKVEALRTIFCQQDAGGLGSNLLQGIEWARKAYSFQDTDRKAFILANIFNKDLQTGVIRSIRGMILGKLNAEHSILGAHSLLKRWCPALPDKEVAEIMSVFTSYAIETRANELNERAKLAGKPYETNLDNEFVLVNGTITAGCNTAVIKAIEEDKPEVVVECKTDGFGKINVNSDGIRKTMIAIYGDSETILRDKLNELVKYYTTPIKRLSNYVDKTAFSA